MLILPRGITGIWSDADGQPPRTNEQEFLAHNHCAARQLRVEVIAHSDSSFALPRNFVYATLLLSSCQISVLLNAHYPLLAFAGPMTDEKMYPDFVDSPQLATEFEKFGNYTILCGDELASCITDEATSESSEYEREDIRYWRPTQLGHVIYNGWD